MLRQGMGYSLETLDEEENTPIAEARIDNFNRHNFGDDRSVALENKNQHRENKGGAEADFAANSTATTRIKYITSARKKKETGKKTL